MSAVMPRVFVAIDPSPPVRARLVELRRDLAATGADVRWVRDEGLHCTLKFLGEMEMERLAAVVESLHAALGGARSFALRARGVGVLPAARFPRVVWVGLTDDDRPGALVALAASLENGLEPLGFRREARTLRPHVTLGRVRGRGGADKLAQRMKAREAEDFGVTRVEEVVVYRSQPRPGGSIYTPLGRIPLVS
jgi:2'-5' RNA ligase